MGFRRTMTVVGDRQWWAIAKSGLVAIGLMALWLLALERRDIETGDAVS